jgi:N-acetylglutamate synthase-like GNAT family acetyltransferase
MNIELLWPQWSSADLAVPTSLGVSHAILEGSVSLKFERIVGADQLVADSEWWRIYDESFPPPYRASREDLSRVLEHPKVVFVRGRLNGETVALATLQRLENPAVIFVGYFAVSEAQRMHGVGHQLLDACVRLASEARSPDEAEPLGLFLEAEHGATRGEVSHATKWFHANGFRLLNFHYEQPPLAGEGPIPMQLLIKPQFPGLRFTPRTLLSLVAALYEQKYRVSYGVSPDILAALLRQTALDLGLPESAAVDLQRKSS